MSFCRSSFCTISQIHFLLFIASAPPEFGVSPGFSRSVKINAVVGRCHGLGDLEPFLYFGNGLIVIRQTQTGFRSIPCTQDTDTDLASNQTSTHETSNQKKWVSEAGPTLNSPWQRWGHNLLVSRGRGLEVTFSICVQWWPSDGGKSVTTAAVLRCSLGLVAGFTTLYWL